MLQKLQLKNELSVVYMKYYSMVNTNCFTGVARLLTKAYRLLIKAYRLLTNNARRLTNGARRLTAK